jgi:hypothetical protein
MGDEPATKADLNHLMARMEAMMGAIESQKSQLDALISGTSSTTPPTPVETSVKPTLNEDDPDEDGDEGDEGPRNSTSYKLCLRETPSNATPCFMRPSATT